MVPMAGVEPAQLSPLPPQGSVSTNFTTSAFSWTTRINLKCDISALKNDHL